MAATRAVDALGTAAAQLVVEDPIVDVVYTSLIQGLQIILSKHETAEEMLNGCDGDYLQVHDRLR